MGHALVLNATYEPLCVVPARRALLLVLMHKAIAVEDSDLVMHSATFSVCAPSVVRLARYVKIPYRGPVPLTRRAVFVRDGGHCVYCGSAATSIDHVVPRSRGGRHEWDNVVSACRRCNHIKADRTVSDLGWRIHPPQEPVGTAWRILGTGRSDPCWAPYLLAFGGDEAVATACDVAELHDLTALEQAAALRAGEVSSLELTDHYLARIDKLSDSVGAFITVTADLAREQARRLDDEAWHGNWRSPLHGVPVPVKDLNLTAGVRTTFGSTVFADSVPDVDDHVVTLLRDAGTVLLGKTNTPEFGLPCYTENAIAPPARTPWDLDRMAGGSSGGAAAAVAAGLAPVAHGNDGGGSVRIPASCCGLFGLKPSRGRVSGGPIKGDVSGLPVEGVLARSVRDAAAMLDVMAVPMAGDPFWAPPLPPGETFLGHAGRTPGRLRVGRFATPVISDAVVHPEVLAAYEETSGLFESLGHDVEDVELPFPPWVVALFETVWTTLSTLMPVDPAREADLQPLTRHLRERGRTVDGSAFALAVIGLQVIARQVIVATASYDVLLSPTLAQPPLPVGGISDLADPASDFEDNKRFTPFTALFNLTGQPAVSLPLGWTADGLPVGMMLAGRPAGDAALLGVAAQVEAAAPWHLRRPACW